jgi:hypothetical protein
MGSFFWFSILSIKRFGEDSNISWFIGLNGMGRSIEAILEGKEHRSCGEHDSGII